VTRKEVISYVNYSFQLHSLSLFRIKVVLLTHPVPEGTSMTGVTIPTGVTGKSTAGIGVNPPGSPHTTNRSVSPQAANRICAKKPTNKAEAIIENEARKVRNQIKDATRLSSSSPVEDNEDMLNIDDFPDHNSIDSRSNLSPDSSKFAQLYRRINSMSPRQFIQMMRIAPSFLGNIISSATSPPPAIDLPDATQKQSRDRILFSEVEEKPRDPMGRKYEIPDAIFDLLACRVHVPLTMTTSEMIERFHVDPSSVKMKTVIDITNSGKKRTLLDVASYPDERDLPIAKFHEAWANMLVIYSRVCSPKILDKIQSHYDFISRLDDFSRDYEPILLFDIDIRRRYTHTREAFDGPDYLQRLQETKLIVMRKQVTDGLQRLPGPLSTTRRDPDRSSNRFNPYDRDSRSSGNSSFRDGKDSRPPRVPCCLRCGEEGHRAENCKATAIGSKGRKPISIWENNKLVDESSRKPFCFGWNLSAKGCRITEDCRNLHVCSLCGSKSHAASSKRCL
jgi:hypothetical protein